MTDTTEQTDPESDITVSKSADGGYVTVDANIGDKVFYIEIGATRFSGYLTDGEKRPVLFEGDIDVVE